jgi:glycosyltransferase involved in cell wall biosynthesis
MRARVRHTHPILAQGHRIALLAPCFWPEVRRGSERFTRELADGLLAAGQRPTLITAHRGAPSRRVEDGLPVLRLTRPPGEARLRRKQFLPYLTHVPLSYCALSLVGGDLAHAVYPTDALAAARWGRRRRRPAVLSFMGVPDFQGLRHQRRMLEVMLRAIDRCDAVVALSEYAGAAFRGWLGYEALVIAPGVDLDAFRPGLAARSELPTIVCAAAAGEPRKQVGLLQRAFALVREQLPQARLVLSRPRDQAALLSAGVAASQPGVEWVDLDDRRELARAYAQAWVGVLPARSEAFGLVLIEAMACGTPVVGFDDGGIPEVIGEDPAVGRLFSEAAPEALADALLDALRLVERPGTEEACRARAAEFSSARCTERYLELYDRLLSHR